MGLPGGRLFRGFYRNSQNGCIDGMVRLITPTTSVFSYGAELSVISLFCSEDEALIGSRKILLSFGETTRSRMDFWHFGLKVEENCVSRLTGGNFGPFQRIIRLNDS